MNIEEIKKRIKNTLKDIEARKMEEEISSEYSCELYGEQDGLEWVLDMLESLEEENKYVGPEHTVNLYDANIIRVGNEEHGWYYEICHENEEELYQNTHDSYTLLPDNGDGFYQYINSQRLEIIASNNINISKKIVDQINSAIRGD